MTELPQIAVPVEFTSIGNVPEDRRVQPAADVRERLAAAWGVLEVPQLIADLTLVRQKDGVVHVTGTVKAAVVQECVVSFQPVRQEIEELIDSRFSDRAAPVDPGQRAGLEVHIDVAAETPEPVRDGLIDISTLVLEHAALAIEPYPRAEGAEIPEEYANKGGSSEESPFAMLSQLVDPQKPKSN